MSKLQSYSSSPYKENNWEHLIKQFNEDWPSTESYTGGRMQEYLRNMLTQAIQEERTKVGEAVKNMVEKSKFPYMFPATEERFIKDLDSLLISKEDE